MKVKNKMVIAAVLLAFLTMPVTANALSYGFHQITSNGNAFIASQLSVDVLDAGVGLVEFRFSNAGPVASSITDISLPLLSSTRGFSYSVSVILGTDGP